MTLRKLSPGALDEIAQMIDAKSDAELASFLGVAEPHLEKLRYGGKVNLIQAADLARRREAHLKAAELLKEPAA